MNFLLQATHRSSMSRLTLSLLVACHFGRSSRAISAGSYHSCGVAKGGTAVCWGRNTAGQSTPPHWGQGTGAKALKFVSVSAALGGDHSCGVTAEGRWVCWGANDHGQSKDPAENKYYTQVSAGGDDTCGLRLPYFNIDCKGRYAFKAPLTVHYKVPANTSNKVKFSSVSVGQRHACGLSLKNTPANSEGAVFCFGSLEDGKACPPYGFQDGSTCYDTELRFKFISAGHEMTCGVTDAGRAVCWGLVSGNGVLEPPLKAFRTVSAGFLHSCGITEEWEAVCWGFNEYGQSTPPKGIFFRSVSAGNYHSCGIDDKGKAHCWGDNAASQSSPPKDVEFEVGCQAPMFVSGAPAGTPSCLEGPSIKDGGSCTTTCGTSGHSTPTVAKLQCRLGKLEPETFTCTCDRDGSISSHAGCAPAPCKIPNSNKKPGLECACNEGYEGTVTWKGSVARGVCEPAGCNIENSNHRPGPDCVCGDGHEGKITWKKNKPTGKCKPAPCRMPNSNLKYGLDCKCLDGYASTLSWRRDKLLGVCYPAPCEIANSTGVGPECRCVDGFLGEVKWKGDKAKGHCRHPSEPDPDAPASGSSVFGIIAFIGLLLVAVALGVALFMMHKKLEDHKQSHQDELQGLRNQYDELQTHISTRYSTDNDSNPGQGDYQFRPENNDLLVGGGGGGGYDDRAQQQEQRDDGLPTFDNPDAGGEDADPRQNWQRAGYGASE